ncbi:MAG TPA: nucleotidyltransferase domain-containing protein [Candidatus Dormibacteraeota bacterium]|nr:nucleotidyltransferase domain-containing protein [Candidatus Dormibacteraeota bacterium]
MADERPAALDVLAPGYRPLFDRARGVFGADHRVRALWLSGSLARGVADAASDLDLLIAVRDEDCQAFAASWPDALAAITPTVVAQPVPSLPGSFYSVTPTGERLDVVMEAAGAVPTSQFRYRLPVFDRDGLTALVPAPAPEPGPDHDRIARLVEEFFRQQFNLPAVIVREDWLLGVIAVEQIHMLLYQLFVAANAPLPPTGVKQWSAKLTPGQRRLLEQLPVPQPTEASVLAARAAAAAAFVRSARPRAERCGVAWPADLERAASAFLARELGIVPTEPLSDG